MKGKKKFAKAAAAAFIATSLTATVVPVYADDSTTDDVTKDESVYTVLNADGSVSEITVSDILHSEDGFDNYNDDSELTDVENLKSNDPVKKSDDGYTWNTKNKDIYYQGKSTKDLPLDVNITYTLDGKEMSADDMLGKSGHVQIRISIDNKEKQNYTVDGKNYTLATPFVTVAGAMLDQDKFSNVKINEGTVQSDSSHNIAAAVMIPGLRDGLKDVLDADTFKTLDSYLIDDVTIDADVKKFESPSIMLAASTSTDALKDEMNDAKLTDVFDDLDKLQEATDKLQSGTQSLYDGADQLNNGASTLNNGVSTLQNGISKLTSGANQLSTGAATLYNGASQVSQGATTLQNGLGQLSANSAALRTGAKQIADGILNTANGQLQDAGLEQVTWSDYASKIGEYLGVNDTMRAQARAQVLAAAQKVNQSVTDDQLDYLLYLALTNSTGDSSDTSVLAKDMQTQGARLVQAQTVQSKMASAQAAAKNGAADPKTAAVLEAVKSEAVNQIVAVEKQNNIGDPQATQTANLILNYVAQNYSNLPGNSLTEKIQNYYASTLAPASAVAAKVAAATTTAKDQQARAKTLAAAGLKDLNAVNAKVVQICQALKLDPRSQDNQGTAMMLLIYTIQNSTSLSGNSIDEKFATAAQEVNNANAVQQALEGASAVNASVVNNILYQETINTIKARGVDDATAALVLAYAANNSDDLTGKNITEKIGSAASALSDAQSVQTAVTASKSTDGQQLINGFLTSLVKGDSSYKKLTDANLITTLNQVNAFVQGVNQYTAGVDSAYAGAKTLASGASQVTSGAKSLSSGAAQLKDGINQLSTGAATLKSGSDALANGTSQLKSGAKTLLDGMKQYNDEGISKLTKNDKISDLKDAADLLDQVKKDGKSYDNYSGISEGTDGSVKFVYKVEGVKEEKKNTASDSDKKDNRTFFQRVADLFKF